VGQPACDEIALRGTPSRRHVHERFRLRTLDDLRGKLAELDLSLPISENLSLLGEPLQSGGFAVPNRFVVQPMEGLDADAQGRPGELAFRRYERYARGGAGLIWFEATAILPEARSNPAQFWLHEGSAETFTRLVKATRAAARGAGWRDPVMVLQLTHSGRYSKPRGIPEPIIAQHSAVLDPKLGVQPDHPLVTDEYLDGLQETFVAAARLAQAAGFDGIDVKSCHGYLLAELLGARTREGRYGGTFENRTRMLRETLARVRAAVPGLLVTTRVNAFDGYGPPCGWGAEAGDPAEPDLREPLELVRLLHEQGSPVLNLTLGNPYYNPHLGRPFDTPAVGAPVPAEHPLVGVARFAAVTRDAQRDAPGMPVIASGLGWLRHLVPYVAAGLLESGWAALVGQGRGALAYPDAPAHVLAGETLDPAMCCVSCSACSQMMRDGSKVGCVVRDSAIYGPIYRQGRRLAPDTLREQARRCRDCLVPTCVPECPAHVDIPAFLRAYADGDIGLAYGILRASNVLPELCGYVCPSESQCEGGCVEQVYCGAPVPIRDIQLGVCRAARLLGLTGVPLPPESSGRSVAVVGAGPAGLACAIKLLELGHSVTLFDSGDRIGGTPDEMIPEARYGTSAPEVDAILGPALGAGRLRPAMGRALGRDLSLDELLGGHDAVFLGLGVGSGATLGAVKGALDALTFLRRVKQGELGDLPGRVAVLGGGNTAVDAAVTAVSLGARDVYVVYRRSVAEMPCWPAERHRLLESGAHVLVLTQPLGYETDGSGSLTGVRIARTELGEPDASGRRSPHVLPGTETVLSVDLAIEAFGQALRAEARAALATLAFGPDGLVRTVPGHLATSRARVWAGGDLVNGGTTAVRAVAEGMKAACEIDEALRVASG